jgi:DNA-binding MarR family transcriptional regulator
MGEHLFELILAVKRKCQRNEEQIQEELGLSQAQFNALIVMDDEGEISGCEFAKRMALSPSRGSRILNTLATGGYVRVVPGPADRRAIMISLTPQGRGVKQRIIGCMAACENRISAGLDPTSVAQVRHALELLESVL